MQHHSMKRFEISQANISRTNQIIFSVVNVILIDVTLIFTTLLLRKYAKPQQQSKESIHSSTVVLSALVDTDRTGRRTKNQF